MARAVAESVSWRLAWITLWRVLIHARHVVTPFGAKANGVGDDAAHPLERRGEPVC